MPRKMIGLVISSMDSEPTLELYRGIIDQAKQYDYSTQGYVIYPSTTSSDLYNEGEFFMFEAIDFTKYDGLIVALNTIYSERVKEKVLHEIKSANMPVVAIDCDIENSIKISNGNYSAIKELLCHLIEDHNCSKINFVSGPLDNEESNERLNGYMDGMKEHNLSYDHRIYTGSFYVQDGIDALNYFESNDLSKDFDAIMCANDMGAISVICELKKRGYAVPEDVKVTGFDNISDSESSYISLTTISKENTLIGKNAVETLHNIWNGKEVNSVTNVDPSIIHRHSCGCCSSHYTSESREKRYINSFAYTKLFNSYLRGFMEEANTCNDFSEYLENLKAFIKKINPPDFQLHIIGEYTDIFDLDAYPKISMQTAGGEAFFTANAVTYFNGQFIEADMFPTKMMENNLKFDPGDDTWKNAMDMMPAKQFLNTPLHFMDKRIGFVIFADSEFPLMPKMYWDWINAVNLTLNSLYNRLLLKELYMTDSLTGAYNRFGLTFFWNKYVDDSVLTHQDICLIFADMNGLKYINDNYGHEHGDNAIELVASALKAQAASKLKAIRYGGDEFILLGYGYTEEQIREIISNISSYISELEKKEKLPYRVSASLGFYIRDYCSLDSLETCIKKADDDMYIAKSKYKKEQADL